MSSTRKPYSPKDRGRKREASLIPFGMRGIPCPCPLFQISKPSDLIVWHMHERYMAYMKWKCVCIFQTEYVVFLCLCSMNDFTLVIKKGNGVCVRALLSQCRNFSCIVRSASSFQGCYYFISPICFCIADMAHSVLLKQINRWWLGCGQVLMTITRHRVVQKWVRFHLSDT